MPRPSSSRNRYDPVLLTPLDGAAPDDDDEREYLRVRRIFQRDMRRANQSMSAHKARYLVQLYYDVQRQRIRAGNRVASIARLEFGDEAATMSTAEVLARVRAETPSDALLYLLDMFGSVEKDVAGVLGEWTLEDPSGMGAWTRQIVGLGPVITAGLLAHIDITKAPTVGHIWRFGGLDPTVQWLPHQLRPWNARLKVVLWKLGVSFQKTCNNPRDIYGHVYAQRRAYEARKNLDGDYAEQAARQLASKAYGTETEAYAALSQGRLPAAQIVLRAQRYAVKAFLSDWHAEYYRRVFKTEPPKPYPIAHLGHAHHMEGRGWVRSAERADRSE